jgi:hypothetical protein
MYHGQVETLSSGRLLCNIRPHSDQTVSTGLFSANFRCIRLPTLPTRNFLLLLWSVYSLPVQAWLHLSVRRQRYSHIAMPSWLLLPSSHRSQLCRLDDAAWPSAPPLRLEYVLPVGSLHP